MLIVGCFIPIDLRWGITENLAQTGQVADICLQSIKRSKPFFIGLLGERYGWTPDQKEFDKNQRMKNDFPFLKDDFTCSLSITEIVTVHRNYLKPLISRINTDDPSRNTVFRHNNIKPDLDICCIILIRYFSEVPSRKLPEITTFPLFYDASFNGNNKEPVLKFSKKHIRVIRVIRGYNLSVNGYSNCLSSRPFHSASQVGRSLDFIPERYK